MPERDVYNCFTYAPFSFSGRGPAESCAQIAAGMAAHGRVRPTIFLGRQRVPLAHGVHLREPLLGLGRLMPWGVIQRPALAALERLFEREITKVDSRSTMVHFWPGSPERLVLRARDLGVLTVREMINSALSTAAPILDEAYSKHGMTPNHGITTAAIDAERVELSLYDYVFASNPEVERSLLQSGVAPERILQTSFGWRPERFTSLKETRERGRFQVVFVGQIGVRKGIPELLRAWTEAEVPGKLVLAGNVDSEVEVMVRSSLKAGRVELAGYVENPGRLYSSSDVFVFPTLEEGGPQVTYEAAGCGLPIITTPMGAARLVEHGRTGLIVRPGSPSDLVEALRLLASDPSLRIAMGADARKRAAEFTYSRVGAQRADLIAQLIRAPRMRWSAD